MTDLQKRLARAIWDKHPIAQEHDAAKLVRKNPRLSPAQQIEVYREQFWLRHTKSLRDDFATLDFLLGPQGFEALCRAYLDAFPPAHFRLRDLSANMEAFLLAHDPYRADPLLADCARIEWALLEAFDAADAPPLDPRVIANMAEDDWPRAKLAFHPSVRIFSCAHPVKAFREDVRSGKKPPRPEAAASFYVTYRRNERLWVEPIERASFHLLDALSRGEPLADACVIAAEHDRELESKLGEWFQRWVTLGWIARVTSSAGACSS